MSDHESTDGMRLGTGADPWQVEDHQVDMTIGGPLPFL